MAALKCTQLHVYHNVLLAIEVKVKYVYNEHAYNKVIVLVPRVSLQLCFTVLIITREQCTYPKTKCRTINATGVKTSW